MKKVLLTVSASILALSLSGVASASTPTLQKAEQATVSTSDTVGENATIKITYVPAFVPGVSLGGAAGGISTKSKNITLKGLGSQYVMTSGSNWLIWSGSNVVKLSGATIITIGYGNATVYAYKGNGQLLGSYYIQVIR